MISLLATAQRWLWLAVASAQMAVQAVAFEEAEAESWSTAQRAQDAQQLEEQEWAL